MQPILRLKFSFVKSYGWIINFDSRFNFYSKKFLIKLTAKFSFNERKKKENLKN